MITFWPTFGHTITNKWGLEFEKIKWRHNTKSKFVWYCTGCGADIKDIDAHDTEMCDAYSLERSQW